MQAYQTMSPIRLLKYGIVFPNSCTKQLRELERDGMIQRKVFRQVTPRVDYLLTKEGRSLVPILEALC